MLLLHLLLLLLSSLPAVLALDNGITSPPLGWMSWEAYGCNRDCTNFPDTCISAQLFQRVADAMVAEGFRDAGYEYVNIDDCYLGPRDAQGNLQADEKRFPGGIKALADYVHARGLKLGVYNDIGSSTCAGDPAFNVDPLDDPTADAQLQRDMDTLKSWEVDSIKVDGCAADKNTFNVTYPKLGRYLNATGRQIFYSCSWPVYFLLSDACNGTFTCVPWDLIAKSCNSWRVFKDIMDIWNLPGHAGIKNIIDVWATNNATLAQNSFRGAYNDPDMIMAGNPGLSAAQAKIQFVLWSMWSAPLMLSTDLTQLSDDMRSFLLNKEVIAIDQDSLGASARATIIGTLQLDGVVQLWVKPLANGDVAAAVVDLGVFDGEHFNATITSQQLGLHAGAKLKIRDTLANRNLPDAEGGVFSLYLSPYDVHLLRITAY